ncbi:uncharacterized protein N7483_008032 [Penicillium malachiteum]|uniref:uncharacterized protein n=1 Tax=Penicillium malachiteum TaxID=1324776 RepID=UPI002546E1E1|nr:uncharacterized protein N7483_008032 [Penicillium malachiteum]KAJ5726675.1 hypothetical protein N7483_008032 [Penicillium malachiteum]
MKLTCLVSLAAFAVSALSSRPSPEPKFTFLFQVNLTRGPQIVYEQNKDGTEVKAFQELTAGGTVRGPKINATMVSGTALASVSADGIIQADASWLMNTTDGAKILVTEQAKIPYVNVLFATSSEKYTWLNNVTSWASPQDGAMGSYSLNYWQVY